MKGLFHNYDLEESVFGQCRSEDLEDLIEMAKYETLLVLFLRIMFSSHQNVLFFLPFFAIC